MGLYRRKDSPSWWYTFKLRPQDRPKNCETCLNGKPHSGSTGTFDEKFAKQIFEGLKTDHLRGKHFGAKEEKITLGELSVKYLERCKLQPCHSGKKIYFQTLFKFKNLGENKPAAAVTRDDCRAFQNWRSSFVAPGTVNRELGTLRHCYNMAIRDMNLNLSNPVSGLPFLSEEKSKRKRFMDTEEKLKFFNDPRLPKDVNDICLFAIKTGMRQGEILNMKWADVNFSTGLINVPPQKSVKERFLGIHPDAMDILIGLSRRGEFVFSNDDGSRMSRHGHLRKRFEASCERLGIKNLHFHDLRHTFASDFVMAGGDLKTLAEYMGHSSIRMTERYAHLSPSYRNEKITLLPRERLHRPLFGVL